MHHLERLGGLKGGKARAERLSAERRSEIARLAAQPATQRGMAGSNRPEFAPLLPPGRHTFSIPALRAPCADPFVGSPTSDALFRELVHLFDALAHLERTMSDFGWLLERLCRAEEATARLERYFADKPGDFALELSLLSARSMARKLHEEFLESASDATDEEDRRHTLTKLENDPYA